MQQIIITTLKNSLNKSTKPDLSYNNVDMNFIEECRIQGISSLIYYYMNKYNKGCINMLPKEVHEFWKKGVYQYSIWIKTQINDSLIALEEIKRRGIEIILLKGMVLRYLYPTPEMRSMSDIDILIKPEDKDKIVQIFKSMGYTCKDTHPIHLVFSKEGKLDVEVHWKLVVDDYFKCDFSEYEKNVWNSSNTITIMNEEYRTLSYEDFVLHLLIHMITHLKNSGFGIRQVYDLVLYVNEYKEQIDFNSLLSSCQKYGIQEFAVVMLYLIKTEFGVDIDINTDMDKELIIKSEQALLNWIFESGVHGDKNEAEGFRTLYMHYSKEEDISKFKRIINLIFPARKYLSSRYNYAKKNIILLPIAWIHHMIYGIFFKGYGIINSLKYMKKGLDAGDERKRLLDTFKL